MDDRRKSPRSGGAILALSIAAGLVIGFVMNQPSIGVLVGTAVGVLLLAAIWWTDRR